MKYSVGARLCALAGAIALTASGFARASDTAANLAPESAARRAELPLYEIIPAAKASELTAAAAVDAPQREWSRSNADAANTRYSSLSQINRDTVSRLEVAWTYRSNDGTGNIQANPVIAAGTMYAPTAGGNIVALDAASGRELWRFRPLTSPQGLPAMGYGPATRGLTYWPGNDALGPRLFFIANGYLFCLDAKTGRRVTAFGDDGRVAAFKGAGTSGFLGAVAPALYDDVIVAPNQNIVEAFHIVTGARLWRFDTLTYPVKDPTEDNGGNVWGGIAMDVTRGVVFVATGDPHPNFIGIDRSGNNLHTNSVLALDARTGRLLWSFQDIAHNLWDLDIPAPPTLVTVMREGKRVDAVAQVTKLGNTLLLDRLTGKPLFPYRLRRAPVSTLQAERTAAYQPDLQLPEPFVRQVFTLDDVTDITPAARAHVLEQIKGATFGWFEPLADGKPTIFLPGTWGGAEWTGAAFDPTDGLLYVSANELPSIAELSRAGGGSSHAGTQTGARVFSQQCALCHGQRGEGKGAAPPLANVRVRFPDSTVRNIVRHGRGTMPPVPLGAQETEDLLTYLFTSAELAEPAPYILRRFDKLYDDRGYPGVKPPWGTLTAIDLNTGKLRWKVPLGEHEELTKAGVPSTGTLNYGGATVTAGGLVFCAGTRDLKIRAFDKTTGRELWQHKLPFGGYAPPAIYEVGGRQFVVIAATGGAKLGGERGDAYVAFALPGAIGRPLPVPPPATGGGNAVRSPPPLAGDSR